MKTRMATLSQTTQTTRTILKWVGVAFAAFLVIRLILFPIGKLIFNTLFPKEPPPPTVEFGKLPKIPFPSGQRLGAVTFAIKTTTGSLPTDLPDRVSVYTFAKRQATFAAYDQAKRKVQNVGFTGEGKALSPILFRWDQKDIEGRQITFDTTTEAFTLTTKLATDSAGRRPPPPAVQAITIAKGFLSAMTLLPKDLDDTKTKTTFLKLSGGILVAATSLSESDYVQVDFFRKPVSDLPIMNPNPKQALLSFRIKTDRDRDEQVVTAQYAYKQIDSTVKPSTYPIKTVQEAFEELKEGRAYVAAGSLLGNTIAVTKVYLAYYEGNDDVEFLLPIFVFEGENGFLAYVSAVRGEWQE